MTVILGCLWVGLPTKDACYEKTVEGVIPVLAVNRSRTANTLLLIATYYLDDTYDSNYWVIVNTIIASLIQN